MRLIPVMLALLLALSPGAVALQASAPTAPASDAEQTATDVAEQTDNDTAQFAPDRNTTSVLTLGTDPARTAFDAPSLSLGDSLTMNRDGFRTQLGVGALDHQLANAESDERRKQLLNRYRYQIENRIISLRAKDQQARQAFSNGTLSEREYLRTLGHIDAEVAQTKRAIDALEQHSSRSQFGFDAKSMKTKMASLEGPVRNRIAETLDGHHESTRIYAETAENGVVLAMIRNGQHVREVYRTDKRDPSDTDQMSFEKAEENVVTPQFPWATKQENIISGRQRQYSSLNVLRFIYSHSHGNLTVYVDTGTEEIYRTIQYKQLTGENSLPPGPGVASSSENVTLTVNRTYPGGPLRVQLTNETGAPLQSQVTVAGEPAGRTNADGVLWTLGPAEPFEVSTTYGDETINVTATPVESES